MLFIEVAKTFEQIEYTSSRLEITTQLSALLSAATPHEAQVICYLAMGQLYPPYIHTEFSIAEKSMYKYLTAYSGYSAHQLSTLRETHADIGAVFGALPWSSISTLSLLEVYTELCGLEKIFGVGSQDDRGKALWGLLAQVTSLEAKYIVRIIVGKLRLGFSDMTIIDALSYALVGDKSVRGILEHAYNVRVDIGLLAYTALEQGIEAIKQVKISVGIPVRPAAAERLPTAQAIIEKIGPAVVQPKLDGFRLQIHVIKSNSVVTVKFFSRHLHNMSELFPDLAAPLADLAIEHSVVLEGEAIGFNVDTGEFKPFQETVKRKRKNGIDEAAREFPLQLFLFDILYLDGKECLSLTHEARRALLAKIMHHTPSKQTDDILKLVPEAFVETSDLLQKYWYEAVSEGLEGVMVKRPSATYQAGKRNFNWIKLKRQDEGHLDDTIDAVIVGYYRGTGKRAALGIGAFLVAVYNQSTDTFETIAKIGTGPTDAEWKDIKARSDVYASAEKPHALVCSTLLTPDVWVLPQIVCKIRADEITLSPIHTAGMSGAGTPGYALRFPRFMGYASDKDAYNASTTKEVKRLFENQVIRENNVGRERE